MDPSKSTHFIVLRTLNALFDVFGILLFAALIFITIKHSKLHGNCHLLIGIFSIFAVFSKSSTFVPFLYFMFPDLHQISSSIGLWLQFLPMCFRVGVHPLMFIIGVDRMLSVFFPIWYTTREEKLYLPLALSIPAIFVAYVTVVVAKDIQTQTNVELFTIGFNDRNPSITIYSLCFVFLTFFCYLSMIIKILCAQSGNASSIRQTVFKFLGLIVLIQIGGWLINLIGRKVVADWESVPKTFVTIYLSCFISLASNSEVLLLYYTSSDHRMAFKKTFGWLFRIISTSNNLAISAVPVTLVNLNLKRSSSPNCQQISVSK